MRGPNKLELRCLVETGRMQLYSMDEPVTLAIQLVSFKEVVLVIRD